MSERWARWVVGLLIATLIMQISLWVRQQHLATALQQVLTRLASQHDALGLDNRLGNMQQQLNELAEGQRWLSRPQVAVEPGAGCGDAVVRIAWQLQNWTPGATATLQYRKGDAAVWQEAQVRLVGEQSYVAEFTLSEEVRLVPQLTVDYAARSRGGPSSTAATAVREEFVGGGPAGYQYRILAGGEGAGRSTAPQSLDLTKVLAQPLQVEAKVGADGHYAVSVWVDARGPAACMRLAQAQVQAFAGPQQVATIDLTGDQVLAADWQSEHNLSRLVLVVTDSGDRQTEVPVPLH